jgi:PilZ domain-containing protein
MAEPNKPPDRRRHPRLELFALVELKSALETLILTVRNLSVGGVLLSADGHDLTQFPMGTRHEVSVFTPDETASRLVLTGEVVRHDAGGMALRWDPDGAALVRLVTWLETIGGAKAP